MKCELVHTKEMNSKTKLQWNKLGYDLKSDAKGVEMRCHERYKRTCLYYEPTEVELMASDELEICKMKKRYFRFNYKLTENQAKSMIDILDIINKNKTDDEVVDVYTLFNMIMSNDCENRVDIAIQDFKNLNNL